MVLDQTSAIELARRGFQGGRVVCRLGCSDLWVLAARPPQITAVPFEEFDGRGRHVRRLHRLLCVTCSAPYVTRGYPSRSRWCGDCRLQAARERDRLRHLARHQARRAAR
jgi:hypothetical protein